MNKLKRIAALLLAVVLCLLSFPVDASAANLPYDTYNYDYWDNVTFTPAAYVPDGTISGVSLGVENFATPQDVCVAPDGDLYIADTGNNRIIVVDDQTKKVSGIIDSFIRDGAKDSFNAPSGICISQNEQLYVADRENKRIVVLELDGTFVKTVQDPKSDVLADDYVFKPLKVSVDYADRVYCIAQNMFQGIMVFETDGHFSGFFGTINVTLSAWDKFWRRIATKEERENQMLYIPTEFTGIDVDESGFVYATNIDEDGDQAVRRLNPRGEDVIKKGSRENVGGDIITGGTGIFAGPSQITDVVYRGKGIYSLLDRKRGRIFTYDHEGNLLYIFGGMGSQEGSFTVPAAIEQWGGQILVLDSAKAEIYLFSSTEYGSLINEAVALRYDGDETLAVPLWERVLELDENNELANSSIGKAYLSAGDNETAMKYLRIGMDREYYSVAFKRYRNEILKAYLGYILTGGIALIVVIYVAAKLIERRRYMKKGGSDT